MFVLNDVDTQMPQHCHADGIEMPCCIEMAICRPTNYLMVSADQPILVGLHDTNLLFENKLLDHNLVGPEEMYSW